MQFLWNKCDQISPRFHFIEWIIYRACVRVFFVWYINFRVKPSSAGGYELEIRRIGKRWDWQWQRKEISTLDCDEFHHEIVWNYGFGWLDKVCDWKLDHWQYLGIFFVILAAKGLPHLLAENMLFFANDRKLYGTRDSLISVSKAIPMGRPLSTINLDDNDTFQISISSSQISCNSNRMNHRSIA